MSARPAPKNIYIIGAQCTGKTTLVKELQAYFAQSVNCHAYSSPSIITEVARKVLKEYEFNRDDITNSVERCFVLQEHILQAQYEAELRMSQEQPTKWYISDRSGVDPVAYASVYAGEDLSAKLLQSREWKILEQRMKRSLVILCEAGSTWLVDDGVRLMPMDLNDWQKVHDAFQMLLSRLGITYLLIKKDQSVESRIALILDAMEET